MGVYADRLKKMNKKMAEQMSDYVPGKTGFEPVPDGEYQFRVKAVIDEWPAKAATETEDAKPARLYVGFQFIVDSGEQEGRTVFNNCGLENKVSAQIARGIIEDLGYEWPGDDLSQLEEIVENITERSPLVTATVKSKPQKNNPEYMNTQVRIQEVLELPEGSDAGEETAEEEPEDEPAEEATEESNDLADADKTALLDFAASQGIEGFTDEHELSDMVEALKEAGLDPIPADNLSDEEKELLERLELADTLIAKEKPKAKPKITPPVKKAAAKPILKGKAKGKK